MNQSTLSLSCAVCGAVADADPPLDWVLTTEGDRVTAHCANCARDNLRSIEARLDPVYW